MSFSSHNLVEINSKLELDHYFNTYQNNLIVVDYYAVWCGPCIQLKPILENLAIKYPEVLFLKVNAEKEDDSYGVRSYPTIQFVKNLKHLDKIIGYNPGELVRLIKIYE